ncbi:hypothetical protein FRC00_005269 [Tulasnella sp. 408]|nr:hypothetical protein FRC00_005269 [Tulasnella sp. 408]
MTNIFLQGQPQPQTNREYVFEDPLAPLRLPPLAQISEFWRRYDRLADIHEKRLTANLNGNLDVLLIFAALFSAINTTFITITMPDLSPNSSDETNNLLRLLVMRADNNTLAPSDLVPPFSPSSNSIIVNGLLYASLSCSLLAAVGAMMAKEWLQSFDRTGQTGPLEEQARFRQRKFNGVLEWHLEAVIKFLPNLLLLSVIFFFVGVCLFLFPINTVVAGIVTAFSGIGVVFSGIVIIAGALSPTCPYQSAAASALRRGGLGLVQFWRLTKRTLVRPGASKTLKAVQKLWRNVRPWIEPLVVWTTILISRVRLWCHCSPDIDDSGGHQPMSQALARSSLMLSDSGSSIREPVSRSSSNTTENEQAEGQELSSATQTHPSVPWFSAAVSQMIERLKGLWQRISMVYILSPFHRSPAAAPIKVNSDQVLTVQAARWLLETTSNRGDQISTAQFICSLDKTTCAEVFEDHDSWKRLLNLTLGGLEIWSSQPNKENQEVAELFGLVLCRVLLQCSKEDEKWRDITDEASRAPSLAGKTFLQTLVIASSKYSPDDPEDDERILHISVIFTALQTTIQTQTSLKEFQWTNPSRLLDGGSAAAASLLVVWARLVRRIGGEKAGKHFIGTLESVVEIWSND